MQFQNLSDRSRYNSVRSYRGRYTDKADCTAPDSRIAEYKVDYSAERMADYSAVGNSEGSADCIVDYTVDCIADCHVE